MDKQLNKRENSDVLPAYARYDPAGLLRVTGEDAEVFLQGQCTQELRADRAPPVTYGLWLNQKGRVQADSHVLRVSGQEWWLFSLESPGAAIRERLEAYIIADDVVIEDLAPTWSAAVLSGAEALRWWEQQGVSPPAPGQLVAVAGGWGFVGRRGSADTWELLLPRDAPVWADWPAMSGVELERRRIRAGIPVVPRDVGENDLPNEAGLDAVAISFTKGCYLGQEVMARLKAMGRVRRSLWQVAQAEAVMPVAGATLYQDGRAVGDLRSCIDDGQGGWIGLAMLSKSNLAPAAALALTPEGPAHVTLVAEASAP